MQDELETTHRRTLEVRVAVEEAWAQFSQESGAEAARRRVEDARASLAASDQRLHEMFENRRRELTEAAQSLQAHRARLEEDQRRLVQAVTEREERLRLGAQQLQRETNSLQTREAAWRSIRDRWQQEKSEAEAIIRGLLAQLSEAAGDDPPSPPPASGAID
ncbi:MAG: hypothetical protein KY476_11505 [Planctomycetes bacterium]|nr:hypothetical protein [Planctomycetota bacterium]